MSNTTSFENSDIMSDYEPTDVIPFINVSLNSPNPAPQWPTNNRFNVQRRSIEEQIFLALITGIQTPLTIVGNLIVLYSYITTKKLQIYANYFVVGLALVDLIAGVFVLPVFSLYFINGIWVFSEQLCEACKFINHVVVLASYLFTLVICVDRYQALKYPF